MRRITFVVYPGNSVIALAALSVFETANMFVDETPYEFRFVSETGGAVSNSLGLRVETVRFSNKPGDTLLIGGGATSREPLSQGLIYAVAPAFVARRSGTIINIASVVGIAAEMLNGVYSASKSYVISFGHSLQNDLSGKGVRVQTVLPGATATEFWDVAGYAAQKTASITMSAEDAVDAALVGLDNGELVTIPGLHDGEAWDRWEADRRELSKKFGNSKPAQRYGVKSTAAA